MGRSDAARAFTFFLPHLSTDDFLHLNNRHFLLFQELADAMYVIQNPVFHGDSDTYLDEPYIDIADESKAEPMGKFNSL